MQLDGNRLASLPVELCNLTALKRLCVQDNRLVALPRQIGRLVQLELLDAFMNVLTSLPREIGDLSALQQLTLQTNRLTWLPLTMTRLTAKIHLHWNPLPIDCHERSTNDDSRARLPELFAATTRIDMIRDEMFVVCVGLQELELPALVTLEIVDAAFPNAIRMAAKWNVITAIKHYCRTQTQ